MEPISLAILSAITEVVFEYLLEAVSERPWAAKVRQVLRGSPAKADFQLALARAFATFAGRYPDLAASFFDERFLTKPAVAEQLARLLAFTRPPDIPYLARLWQAQFAHSPDVDLAEPLCFFFSQLEAELKAFPDFRAVFDSKSLETIADHAASTNQSIAQMAASLNETNQALREIASLLQTDRIAPQFKEMFLAGANHRCSICHTDSVVNLYPIDPAATYRKLGYEGLIALCPDCYQRVHREGITSHELRVVKMVWSSACKAGESPFDISEAIEQRYREAVRLSLSPDLDDVRRAIIHCRGVSYCNPFHTEARILLERLLPVEKAMAKEMAQKEIRLRARFSKLLSDFTRRVDEIHWAYLAILGSILSVLTALPVILITHSWHIAVDLILVFIVLTILRRRWVAAFVYFYFLQAVLIHEVGHILAIYTTGDVKNAVGQRMPLVRHFKYIELDINGVPLQGGIKEAVKRFRLHGELPALSVNWSRMKYEWYMDIKI